MYALIRKGLFPGVQRRKADCAANDEEGPMWTCSMSQGILGVAKEEHAREECKEIGPES